MKRSLMVTSRDSWRSAQNSARATSISPRSHLDSITGKGLTCLSRHKSGMLGGITRSATISSLIGHRVSTRSSLDMPLLWRSKPRLSTLLPLWTRKPKLTTFLSRSPRMVKQSLILSIGESLVWSLLSRTRAIVGPIGLSRQTLLSQAPSASSRAVSRSSQCSSSLIAPDHLPVVLVAPRLRYSITRRQASLWPQPTTPIRPDFRRKVVCASTMTPK